MPFREYEAKVFVENEDDLLQKLQKNGAVLLKQILQRDTYYDLDYRLTKKDELLRIRIVENINTHEFKAGEFSWKSSREGTHYEVREDISIPLLSAENAHSLEIVLKRLGFRRLAWLIKYRDRWRLDKVEFEFDKFIEAQAINRPKKKIGSYLQATIETEHEYPPEQMDSLLWNSLNLLGFDRTHLRMESYIELYLIELNEMDSIRRLKKRDI
ncbi:MAG: CYTH domain-containing protein [Candidatus Helarchaeota archaeon]|nr:CYTH domain-containing protein [Candidatus Helarchaeota archaeon]